MGWKKQDLVLYCSVWQEKGLTKSEGLQTNILSLLFGETK